MNWQVKTVGITLGVVAWTYVGNVGYTLVNSSSNTEVLLGFGLLAVDLVVGITALLTGLRGVEKWLEQKEDVPRD